MILKKIFFLPLVFGLSPKKLPNGNSRKFIPNKNNPRNDLKLKDEQSVSLITTNWMNNIVLHLVNNKKKYKKNILEYDDLHIVTSINNMKKDIEFTDKENRNISLLYFSWEPECIQGFQESLFIVIAKLDLENKIINIDNIIQSPFWDSEQIDSIYLKYSLIDQNESINKTNITFNPLYQNNIRYKLSWETWYLD
jgi:hypothetical protein